jgi:putative tricarboxylic transport membrane protein
VYAVFIGLILVNLLILPVGLLSTRLWALLIHIPTALLWPAVILLSMVGAYALRSNLFDVGLALAAGALGYVLMRGGYPLAPLVLGVILGPMVESNLRLAMILSEGSLVWLTRPIPIALMVLLVLTILLTRRSAKTTAPAAERAE